MQYLCKVENEKNIKPDSTTRVLYPIQKIILIQFILCFTLIQRIITTSVVLLKKFRNKCLPIFDFFISYFLEGF